MFSFIFVAFQNHETIPVYIVKRYESNFTKQDRGISLKAFSWNLYVHHSRNMTVKLNKFALLMKLSSISPKPCDILLVHRTQNTKVLLFDKLSLCDCNYKRKPTKPGKHEHNLVLESNYFALTFAGCSLVWNCTVCGFLKSSLDSSKM